MYHLIHKFNLFDDTHVRHLSETLYSEVRVVDKEIQENISTALYVKRHFFINSTILTRSVQTMVKRVFSLFKKPVFSK